MTVLFDPMFVFGVMLAVVGLVIAVSARGESPPEEPFNGEVVDDFPTDVFLAPGDVFGKTRHVIGEVPRSRLSRPTRQRGLERDDQL
jgi:hypothetical protein